MSAVVLVLAVLVILATVHAGPPHVADDEQVGRDEEDIAINGAVVRPPLDEAERPGGSARRREIGRACQIPGPDYDPSSRSSSGDRCTTVRSEPRFLSMRTPALPITLVVLALAALASTGCGTERETASATTVVERVTVPAEATTRQPADTTSETAGDDSGSASTSGGGEDSSDSSNAASSSDADCVEVPDVVGLSDLQLSQDTLQAAGFYVMDQEDATGQGRAQLLDRNWVVTRQDPKAGECVDTSTTVTTYAKKHGE